MKNTLSVVFNSLVVSALLTGCNGNDSSKSSSMVTTNFSVSGPMGVSDAVAFKNYQKALNLIIPSAVAMSMPLEFGDAKQTKVQLNEAWIVLKKIQFKSSQTSENGEEQDQNFHYKGPFYVDLLSDEVNPFGAIEVPASGLRRVKMLLHKANDIPNSAPAALEKKSIYLSGNVDGKDFTYAADDTTDLQVSGPRAVIPEEGKDLMVVIRLPEMIKKIDFSAVTDGVNITSSNRVSASNPCPSIHATASDLYACFRKGLVSEAKFGKDNDSNRVLDADEDNG